MNPVIPFSELLRARTRSTHGTSAGAGFMTDLMRGTCSVDDYASLVAQYWFVYGALERATTRMAEHPVAAPFITSRLTRLPALEADLDYLIGPDWRSRVSALDTTAEYVARLDGLASVSAGAFVAHHYTRYLGDLSGGQFIRTVLQKHYGFETNGVGFYVFAEVADPADFKAVYRAQLDDAPWTDDEKEAVVAEVVHAYDLNSRLLDELDTVRRAAIA